MKILAIIPITGSDPEYKDGHVPMLGSKSILNWTFDAVKESRLIDHTIVATDSEFIAEETGKAGLAQPYFRDPTERTFGLGDLFKKIVDNLRITENYEVDWVVQLWVNYPFRRRCLLDRSIEIVTNSDLDSAFLACPEFKTYWNINEEGRPEYLTTDSHLPRNQRPPIYRDLRGLFSMTHISLVERKLLIGGKAGIIPINYFGCNINLHDLHERKFAEIIAQNIDLSSPDAGVEEQAMEQDSPRRVYHSKERSSLILNKDILKGNTILTEHLAKGISDIGISEDLLPAIAGKCVSLYDLKRGEPLTFGVIEWKSQ